MHRDPSNQTAPAISSNDEPGRDCDRYVRSVLNAYCATPGTTGRANRQDRLLATRLFQRGIPLLAVENALLLASARRLFRPPDAHPLPTIRSLNYFSQVIEEVLALNIGQDYFRYIRLKLDRYLRL